MPISGRGDPPDIQHLILPAVVLGLSHAGSTARLFRAMIIDVMRQDYIRSARARGIARPVIIFKYAFRNALIPAVTDLSVSLADIIGSVILIETVFSWPGIGLMVEQGILYTDFPVLSGAILTLLVYAIASQLPCGLRVRRHRSPRPTGGMMTTEARSPLTQAVKATRPPAPRDRGRLRRFLRSKPAVVSAVILILLLLAVVIGPFFAPDPNVADITAKLQGHSSAHLLGTDDFGRDILARALLGGRVSFIVAFAATAVAVVGGGILGIIAGYWRGPVDDVISRIFDILLAFPMLLLAIIILAALGPSLAAEIIAIGMSDFPRYGRLVRAMTLEAKEREYVRSAVTLGYSRRRILLPAHHPEHLRGRARRRDGQHGEVRAGRGGAELPGHRHPAAPAQLGQHDL